MNSLIVTRNCGLCGKEANEEDLGKLFPDYFKIGYSSYFIFAIYECRNDFKCLAFHFLCKRWAGELWNVKDVAEIKANLEKAYLRGKKMKCSLCKQYGATVGCAKRGYILL